MVAAPSGTTFIVEERLPWPDTTPAVRVGPLDRAGLYKHPSVRHDCFLRKVSPLGATIVADIEAERGVTMSVELSTGQRAAATLAWIARGELGAAFNQPVDVLTLINRSLVSQPAERRTMPRVEVRRNAYVRWAGKVEPALIRNISSKGLQLEGDELPQRDTFVSVFVEGLVLPGGAVVWRKPNLAGIQLREEVSWTSIIPWLRKAAASSS